MKNKRPFGKSTDIVPLRDPLETIQNTEEAMKVLRGDDPPPYCEMVVMRHFELLDAMETEIMEQVERVNTRTGEDFRVERNGTKFVLTLHERPSFEISDAEVEAMLDISAM